MITSNAEEMPDLDEMAQKMKESQDKNEAIDPKDFIDYSKMTTMDACHRRMKGVILDIINLGYL